ncbi:NAD(P)H-dependent oxidoreductase [Limosilactobacillus sp. STM2_1]|uniref:NAD(P)H-dependent oxidoreductase n=1 Tax=Limosilactobacillus rudii TaxID=2759755 RepID=A0A7W3UKX8_9LACO|nr:NADPH-dependent FMN reductase [Limosilactobacillus rudii]MBB1079465.1 NAD(P)H-dependent oxidoreductase [Limosilactobacillus rudii]MBB1097511.1 NAD(P)H-dependent oxidoreductase [Limosilactobacillus rudii]MCD7134621.1 NAD(P)H-dependent oxidoreductase [Limosilactobacillus rudii]
MINIGVFVGSLSQNSYSQKIASYLMNKNKIAKFFQINYDILPLYNPDLEKNPPLEWQVIRSVVDKMDALLIVTQEYNFSIPGGLKNAIDVLSVPSPQPHIYQKPALVITDSSGARGGANANAHIQQLLRYIGMNVMNKFVTIGNVQGIFDDNNLTDKKIAKRLNNLVNEFIQFTETSKRS